MSIQASWNRMVGSVGALSGLARIGKAIEKPKDPDFGNMSAEELAAYAGKNNPEGFNKAVNGIQERLVSKYGVSEEDAQRLSDDIRLGKGEGWTSRFDEARMAAKRAQDAAAEADSKPANTVTTAEEAVQHLLEIQRQSQGGNV